MRLRRVEIREFRKLAGPLVLDGIGDGLTVIGGDNEEGKSTVLAALKAGLFEHHTVGGQVREAMTPYGGGTPEVTIEFTLGGGSYRLVKAFRRGGVKLETPQGRLADEAAEQRLVELLRFERRSGRAEARPQHRGLQAVFWVDQGTTFAGFDSLTASRNRLAAAVEAETGKVAAGDRARRLLETAEAETLRYFTAGTGRETGELAEAAKRLQALQKERDELAARLAAHGQRVDRLARLRDERRRLLADDEAGRARAQATAARDALRAVESLEAELRLAEGEVQVLEAEWQRLRDADAARRQLQDGISAAANEIRQSSARLAEAKAAVDAADQVAAVAVGAETALVERVTAAEAAVEAARRRRELVDLDRGLNRLRADLAGAETAAKAVRTLKARLDAEPVTEAKLKAARKADAELAIARQGLAAVATTLEFQPEPGATVRVGGRVVDPVAGLRLTEPTEVELLPFGRIMVIPGAGDLDSRRQACRKAEEALQRALAAMAAASLPEAEARGAERVLAERELRDAEQRLQLVLQGHDAASVAALEQQVASAEAQRDRLAAALDGVADDGDVETAASRLGGLRRELEVARAETQRTARHAAALRADLGHLSGGLEQRRQQQQGLERQLAELVARQDDAALAAALQASATASAAARQRRVELEQRLKAADPEFARQRLALAERRAAELAAEAERVERAIRDVEVELRSTGADADGERHEELKGLVERAEADGARLRRTGLAWRLLRDELTAEIARARDALLAPVRERLQPYLARLFGDAELVIDSDSLVPTHLRRGDVPEPLEGLSVGSREQIAVLVRLALASLLRDREGEAPCLVLDDALVYADEHRFEVMKTILQQAAAQMQIVILTCRPRDYRGLSGRFLRLEDCGG
ncbi:MAG: AAA family ATPase [Geminicoccaceae bacterium]